MVVDLRQHVAELAVVSLFAVAGFVAVCWVAKGWAERAADWLRRDRIDPPWWWKPWLSRRVGPPLYDEDDDEARWAYPDDGLDDELPPPLPPERTWEQMTSHQLPVTGSDRHADDLMDGGGLWHGPYAPQRERRAPWWEAEQRQAYEALGLEYPSGLMARVREAAQ